MLPGRLHRRLDHAADWLMLDDDGRREAHRRVDLCWRISAALIVAAVLLLLMARLPLK